MFAKKEAIRRLASDVKFITKNPLNEEGIFYKHDEENILKGYALIIGNENTPYENGAYFFEFNFPTNYPEEPPKVVFLTNDGYMRFNPNLYTNGKVCLSILNTWNGEGWTSCQTRYSILMSLLSIFNEDPLLNEPGIKINNPDNVKYNKLIMYKNIEFSLVKQYKMLKEYLKNSILLETNCKTELELKDNKDNKNYKDYKDNKDNNTLTKVLALFSDIFIEHFNKNKTNIEKKINEFKLENNNNDIIINIKIYNISVHTNFDKLLNYCNNL